jgi:uncharacterized protein YndB with AHSA1/START domain
MQWLRRSKSLRRQNACFKPRSIRWSENEYCDLTVWEMDVQVRGFWQSVSIPRAGKGDSHARYEHRGRILELKPPFLLAYTWLANFHEQPRRETIVRVDFNRCSYQS